MDIRPVEIVSCTSAYRREIIVHDLEEESVEDAVQTSMEV